MRGKGLWKFKKSLLSNDEYTDKLKNHISESLRILDQNGIKDDQISWEYIKFEIRQFSITFSKNLSNSLTSARTTHYGTNSILFTYLVCYQTISSSSIHIP